MAKPARTRWVCPNGCPAVLGPTRPRRDNIVRYCLACSAKAGKLVERTAPAMEKKSKASAERSSAKAKLKAMREREREAAKWTVEGVDLRKALTKAMRLPSASHMRREPGFTISRSRTKDYTTGRAWDTRRIHLTIGVGESASRAVGVLLHELAHVACYRAGEDGGDASRRFAKRCHDLHDEWNAKYAGIVEVDIKASGAYAGPRGRRTRDWSRSRTGAILPGTEDEGVSRDTYLQESVWEDIEAGFPDGCTLLIRPALENELDARYIDTFDGDVEAQPERAKFIEEWRAGEVVRERGHRRWKFRISDIQQLRHAIEWAVEDWDDEVARDARRAAVLLVRQLRVQAKSRLEYAQT